jgi:hypothetical protein
MHRFFDGQEETMWSVAVTDRKVIGTHKDASIEEVTINRSEARTPTLRDKWHVLVERIPRSHVSKNHHAIMSKSRINSVSIGIAGLVSEEHNIGRYRIFFGVPITTMTSLPVHIHGTFILAKDRRNIRFEDDGGGNEESKFNKYLLSEKVSRAYLRFMETWPTNRKIYISPWWPPARAVNITDIISRTVTDALKSHFPASERLVCTSLAKSRTAPAKCVFIRGATPVGVNAVLKLITPKNVTKCPPSVWSEDLPEVDDCYLASVLKRHQDIFRSLFSSGEIGIQEVADTIRFLTEGRDKRLLIGLPLIPLMNGGLAVFTDEHDPPCVYTWKSDSSRGSVLPWDLFGSDHFLHRDFDAELMVDLSLNVSALTGDTVIKFVESRFRRTGELVMTPQDQLWIQDVCSILVGMSVPVKKEALVGLPLIPTYSSHHSNAGIIYLSIDVCEQDNIILLTHEVPFLPLLERLGARLVKRNMCPPILAPFITTFEDSFEAVLKFFGTITQGEIASRFNQLRHDEHQSFAKWIRDHLESLPDPGLVRSERSNAVLRLIEISARLPVWEVIRVEGGRFVDGLAASREIEMFPYWVELSFARPFIGVSGRNGRAYAEYSATLAKLQVSKLDTAKFRTLLEFRRIMPTVPEAYVELLRGIVLHWPPSAINFITVPNENGRMVCPDILYSRSQILFREIFSTRDQQHNLLHHSLVDLEARLTKFGLRDNLSFDSFLAVASAVHEEPDGADKVRRAELVYDEYSNRLYGLIYGDASLWAQLDNLRFIPRTAARRRNVTSNIPFDQFTKQFPNVVSPAELLFTDFEPVAWTQRVLFRDEPSQQLAVSHSSLGKPTAKEVVSWQCTYFGFHN